MICFFCGMAVGIACTAFVWVAWDRYEEQRYYREKYRAEQERKAKAKALEDRISMEELFRWNTDQIEDDA